MKLGLTNGQKKYWRRIAQREYAEFCDANWERFHGNNETAIDAGTPPPFPDLLEQPQKQTCRTRRAGILASKTVARLRAKLEQSERQNKHLADEIRRLECRLSDTIRNPSPPRHRSGISHNDFMKLKADARSAAMDADDKGTNR